MRFTVITANYNGGAYLEETICSVLEQKQPGVDLEYIVVDGQSTDNSPAILAKYTRYFDRLIVEADTGPANAINKGFAAATGDMVSWLNADDLYFPGTLVRVKKSMERHLQAPFCFGACPIIDPQGREIRKGITRFKAVFFPLSSRFAFQCLNYISQPAMFFRRGALQKAGRLIEGLTAAWDYDLTLRLWRQGRGLYVKGPPLAAFRWHEASIGGRHFQAQFKEELDCAVADAGPYSVQALLHHLVRWGIVGSYTIMGKFR